MENKTNLTKNEMISQILQENPGKRFKAFDIANEILDRFPEWCENKKSNSVQNLNDKKKILSQLASELNTSFKTLAKKKFKISDNRRKTA